MKKISLRFMLGQTIALTTVAVALASLAGAERRYTVLHSFQDNPAAIPFAALVADSAGNLYGTAADSAADSCGSQGCGAVFKLTLAPRNKWKYSVIHRFTGPDGNTPLGSLIFDGSGNLFGTTSGGGAHGLGTVFELSPSSSGWKESVLYSFAAPDGDGDSPQGGLIFDDEGNLYGTAEGGAYGKGAVFQLKPSSGRWHEALIYNFTGSGDGAGADGTLTRDSAGNLYGTAGAGGQFGQGVLFELTPSGGTWTETVLYSFSGGADGSDPNGGVTFDAAGNLYGTTLSGGLSSCDGGYGCGTIFQFTPATGGGTLSTIHTFKGTDGSGPFGVLLFDSSGSLYGTTTGGGIDYGVVFKLSPKSGGGWTETLPHQFNLQDGAFPYGGLILNGAGALYGTAKNGGAFEYGVVFKISP